MRIAHNKLMRLAAVLGLLAASGMFAGRTHAAQQEDHSTPLSKVEQLNRAPVSKEVLRVKWPKPTEATLPNGITVLILEDHRFPTVSAEFEVEGAGALYEPADQPGLAGATAALMRQGTKTHSSQQLAQQIAALGATVNAGAPFGSAVAQVAASGLSDNFDQWFALAVDVLLHPAFPSDELEQYKGRARPNLLQQRTQPNFLVNQTFNRAVYGNFPASVVSPTPESLDALTSAAMAKWHNERFTPQNTILAISGDVQSSTLLPKLKQWLAEWQKTDLVLKSPVGPPPAAKSQVYLVDRPGSVQTSILMGNLAVKRDDPDYPALIVMNEVLGAGASGRLFMNLRENKGYTYGVYSGIVARKYAGPWTAGGDVRTEVTDGAMTQFLYELNRIRDEKVPADELDSAKRAIVARFALSLESPQQLIGYAVTRKQYNFPVDYWDKYPAELSAVTADDVQRVAKKYINPGTMQIVAVGDLSKIKSVMEKYGPAEVVDPTKSAAPGKPAATSGAGQ